MVQTHRPMLVSNASAEMVPTRQVAMSGCAKVYWKASLTTSSPRSSQSPTVIEGTSKGKKEKPPTLSEPFVYQTPTSRKGAAPDSSIKTPTRHRVPYTTVDGQHCIIKMPIEHLFPLSLSFVLFIFWGLS